MSDQGYPSYNHPVLAPGGGLFSQIWYQFFQQIWNRTGGNAGGVSVPTGCIAEFATATPPAGWLKCDGTAVSRTQYSTLFGIIGTTWGAGDGSTTFNLPNFTNKFSRGGSAVGTTGGQDSVTLTTGQLPAHSHGVNDPGHVHTVTDPGHVHASIVAASTNTAGAAAGSSTAGNTSSATTGITLVSATTGITTQNTGSGQAVATLPAYAVVLKCIKF